MSTLFTACGHSFYLGMTINTPKIGMFGLGTMSSVQISNPTPYYAVLGVLDVDSVCTIPPFGVVQSKINVKFEGEQYPVVLWMKNSPNGERVGVAYGTLTLSQDQPANWAVTQVQYPDGRYSYYSGYGQSPFREPDMPRTQKVDLPNIDLGTTVYIQFINCTYFRVANNLSTGHTFTVPSMNVFTLPYRNVNRIRGSVGVQTSYIDRGRVVGLSSESYSVDVWNTPQAKQILFTPSRIQTARY